MIKIGWTELFLSALFVAAVLYFTGKRQYR